MSDFILENSFSLLYCNEIKFIFLILEIFLKFVNENDLLKSLLLFQQIAILMGCAVLPHLRE